MAISIEPAHLDRDKDCIISSLEQFLPAGANRARFDWLYLSSPFGRAQVWLAVESMTRSVIGVAAAFPRRFRQAGKIVEGCVWGDFCIDPKHRSVGPALQLQRACLDAVASGPWEIAYDFPSDSMAAIYSRLGTKIAGQIVRLAKPLRTERLIESKIKSKALASGLSRIGNAALRLKSGAIGAADFEVRRFAGRCGTDFTELANANASSSDEWIEVERSAEYLNWRYLDHPSTAYEIYEARKADRLLACAVVAQNGADATIVDLLGAEAAALKELIAFVENEFRERKVMTLSVPVSDGHRLRSLLEGMGFREREGHPIIGYVRNGVASASGSGSEWSLMDGDRES